MVIKRSTSRPARSSVRWLLAAALVVVVGGTTWHIGSMTWMPGRSHAGQLPTLSAEQSRLKGELRRDLQVLTVEIGHRGVHSPAGLRRAEEFITGELEDAGYQVSRQTYMVNGVESANLSVERIGRESPHEIFVVGAHYDSVFGTVGANDNGTGTVALLALARRFSAHVPNKTLRFVAFVNEEPPHFQTAQMGSLVYAQACKQRGEKIVGMISLETLGFFTSEPQSQHYPWPFGLLYPTTGNFVAFVGNDASAGLVRSAIGSFRRHARFPSEGLAAAGYVHAAGLSDQWAFWQCGYPALMVTDTAMFRYKHYHRESDTMDKISWDAFARVVDGMGAVIEELTRN